jgi:hypothetical protein
MPNQTTQSFPRILSRASAVAVALVALPLANCHEAQPVAPSASSTIDQAGLRRSFASPRQIRLAGQSREIKSLLNIPRRMSYGEFSWNAANVPPAPVWIIVDLDAQTMSVFRGPHEIASTVLLFGMDEKPTPTGRFRIEAKNEHDWSRTYDAPMPYALRLTADGVAIHGSDVQQGSATHGCIGVPLDFARKLFAVARVGDEVVVAQDLRAALA